MPQSLRDARDVELDRLSNAAVELVQAAEAMRSWRTTSSGQELDRLESLQQLLVRVDKVDAGAADARRAVTQSPSQPAARQAVAHYENALQAALQEIGELERVLDAERTRLSPRVDSAVRESEARTAYARSLARN